MRPRQSLIVGGAMERGTRRCRGDMGADVADDEDG